METLFESEEKQKPTKGGASKGFNPLKKIGIVGLNIGYAVFS